MFFPLHLLLRHYKSIKMNELIVIIPTPFNPCKQAFTSQLIVQSISLTQKTRVRRVQLVSTKLAMQKARERKKKSGISACSYIHSLYTLQNPSQAAQNYTRGWGLNDKTVFQKRQALNETRRSRWSWGEVTFVFEKKYFALDRCALGLTTVNLPRAADDWTCPSSVFLSLFRPGPYIPVFIYHRTAIQA